MDNKTFKQLLRRYVSGSASDSEKKTIDTWYDSYRELDDAEVFGCEAESTRIGSQLHTEVSGHWMPPKRIPYRGHLAYAASALMVLGVSWAVFFQEQNPAAHRTAQAASSSATLTYQQVETVVGQVKKITLPDGSMVWVNALSSLRVPKSFGKPTRALYLDEGEAYFEVAHDPSKPFVVHSRGLSTRVLGTAFNVNAYKRLGSISVTVTHGKVAVADSNQHQLAAPLTEAQQLIFDTRSGSHTLNEGVSHTTASWREGATHLRDASFENVALAFFNTYGVELKAGSQAIHDHRYSLVIRTTNRLDETLRIICSIHQNQFRRKDHEVIIY